MHIKIVKMAIKWQKWLKISKNGEKRRSGPCFRSKKLQKALKSAKMRQKQENALKNRAKACKTRKTSDKSLKNG